jgi:GH24 family phage-related lysozyme (muramidase)
MREPPDIAVAFLKNQEGLRLKSYADSAGVWTIGYGHTGPEVVRGMAISEPMAERLLKQDVVEAAAILADRISPGVLEELNEQQYAALLSFAFNVGADPKWRIWDVLERKAFDTVPAHLSQFRFARDPNSGRQRELKGLVRRRADEAALWGAHKLDEPQPAVERRIIESHPAPAEAAPEAASSTPVSAEEPGRKPASHRLERSLNTRYWTGVGSGTAAVTAASTLTHSNVIGAVNQGAASTVALGSTFSQASIALSIVGKAIKSVFMMLAGPGTLPIFIVMLVGAFVITAIIEVGLHTVIWRRKPAA